MWKTVIGIVGKLLWSQRHRLKPKATDEELRAIARQVWSAHSLGHTVPFSVVQGWARDALNEMGYQLDDDTDSRLVDVLDNERAKLRMPAQLDELASTTGRITATIKAAEAEGRAAVTSWAATDDDQDKE